MFILRQSTASQEVLLGPFVDSTDGVTAETGLTIANTDIKIFKAGATTLANKNSGGATHISAGNYYAVLDATDTDTVGSGAIVVQVSGALAFRMPFTVLEEAVFDALYAASAPGYVANAPVNVAQFGGSNGTFASGRPEVNTSHFGGTAGTFASGRPEVNTSHFGGSAGTFAGGRPEVNVSHFGGSAGTFASGIPSTVLTTSGVNAVADQVWDEVMSGHTASGSFGQSLQIIRTATAQAGASTTITLDASASATDDFYNNDIIQIIAGTGAGQARFITDYNGTSKVATVGTWAVNPSSDSVFVIKGFDAIPGATAPTAAEVADAVWDEARADHVASGSFGQLGLLWTQRIATAQAGGASSITLDASASATNDLYKYGIITILSGTGAAQSRQISAYNGSSKVATVSLAWTTQPDATSVFALAPLGVDAATVAQIADGVWDEARSGHVTAGTFGEYTNADVLRLSGDATAADNAESFFDGTGYAGTNNVIPSVTTVTGNVNGNVAGSVGSVTGAVGSVTGAVGSVTGNVGGNVVGSVASVAGNVGGNVVGSVGSLDTQAKADVNAEVLDVLNVDTFAQPGQATPAATTTIRLMLAYLYKAWRNRVDQTSSEYRLFNDDATTVDQKATASDNGTTASRGEVATGP